MRISDWSSDVCSSDLLQLLGAAEATHRELEQQNDGATDRAAQHHGDGVVQLGLRKRRAGRDAGQREDARLRLGVVELGGLLLAAEEGLEDLAGGVRFARQGAAVVSGCGV